MSDKECIICGKPLRSGIKYCWRHRGHKEESVNDGGLGGIFLLFVVFAIIILGSLWFFSTFSKLFGSLDNLANLFLTPIGLIFLAIISAIIAWKIAKKSKTKPV